MLKFLTSPTFYNSRFLNKWVFKFRWTDNFLFKNFINQKYILKKLTYNISYFKGKTLKKPKYLNKKTPKYNYRGIVIKNLANGMYVNSLYLSEGFITFNSSYTNYHLIRSVEGLRKITLSNNFNLFQFFTNNTKLVFNDQIANLFNLFFNIKLNSKIFFIRNWDNTLNTISTSYGSFSKLLARDDYDGFYLVDLPSKKKKFYLIFTQALIVDEFSNLTNSKFYKNIRHFYMTNKFNYSKAGYYSNLGKRPKVRGVAMNPVDHPHGGRTKSIKCPKTPWGHVTKKK